MPTLEIERPTCLLSRTRHLLKHRPRAVKLSDIAEATGLTLGWLNSFNANMYGEPSVIKVQTLYEHLSGEKLIKVEE